MTYQSKLDALIAIIQQASPRIKSVTTDLTAMKPSNTGVVVLIHPPDVEFDQWDRAEYAHKLWLVAGRAWNQNKAYIELLETIEELTHSHVNMKYATPTTFSIDGVGELAGYEITLNPLDIGE